MARKPKAAAVPRMLFSVMEFRPGLNVTVRLGDKWFRRIGQIEIARTEDGVAEKQGTIIDTLYVERFEDLNESVVLRLVHDPFCVNFYNLVKAMTKLYPGNHVTGVKPFTRDSAVTVVFFTVDGEEEHGPADVTIKLSSEEAAPKPPRAMTGKDAGPLPNLRKGI